RIDYRRRAWRDDADDPARGAANVRPAVPGAAHGDVRAAAHPADDLPAAGHHGPARTELRLAAPQAPGRSGLRDAAAESPAAPEPVDTRHRPERRGGTGQWLMHPPHPGCSTYETSPGASAG